MGCDYSSAKGGTPTSFSGRNGDRSYSITAKSHNDADEIFSALRDMMDAGTVIFKCQPDSRELRVVRDRRRKARQVSGVVGEMIPAIRALAAGACHSKPRMGANGKHIYIYNNDNFSVTNLFEIVEEAGKVRLSPLLENMEMMNLSKDGAEGIVRAFASAAAKRSM